MRTGPGAPGLRRAREKAEQGGAATMAPTSPDEASWQRLAYRSSSARSNPSPCSRSRGRTRSRRRADAAVLTRRPLQKEVNQQAMARKRLQTRSWAIECGLKNARVCTSRGLRVNRGDAGGNAAPAGAGACCGGGNERAGRTMRNSRSGCKGGGDKLHVPHWRPQHQTRQTRLVNA